MIISMNTYKLEVRGKNTKSTVVLRLKKKKPQTLSNMDMFLVAETYGVLGLEYHSLESQKP